MGHSGASDWHAGTCRQLHACGGSAAALSCHTWLPPPAAACLAGAAAAAALPLPPARPTRSCTAAAALPRAPLPAQRRRTQLHAPEQQAAGGVPALQRPCCQTPTVRSSPANACSEAGPQRGSSSPRRAGRSRRLASGRFRSYSRVVCLPCSRHGRFSEWPCWCHQVSKVNSL
jgi:hypothetical protein